MADVVSCLVLNNENKLLILKRSKKVGTYKEMWGGITGYVEKNEIPYETALKEIKEESGIKKEELIFIDKLELIKFNDTYNGIIYEWNIFSFLFKTEKKGKIDIDWEHSEYRWITPSEVSEYKTVPLFEEIVKKMLL